MQQIRVTPKELFRVLRVAYLPLLFGYFAHSISGMYGMGSGITTIAANFWIQEALRLSPEKLALMSFTIGLPWTSKILFGQLVDSWTMKRRKQVIVAAGAVMIFGFLILAALAGNYEWITKYQSYFHDGVSYQFFFLTLGYLLVSATMCLQDCILDPLGRQAVSRKDDLGNDLSEEEFRYKVGLVQLWCRISFTVASIIGMTIGGFLMANEIPMDKIFLVALFVPFMTVSFIQFISPAQVVQVSKPNLRIIVPALMLIALAAITQLLDIPMSREISFIVSLGVVIYMIRILAKKGTSSAETRRGLIFTAVTLSLITFLPGYGDGVSWWAREELGFTRQFETQLGIFGQILSLGFLVFCYRSILKGHLGSVLIWFNIILSVLGSLYLMFWHGWHVWIGNALGMDPLAIVRGLVWINTAISSPFWLLYGMIMFIFLAQYADDEGTATWFTVFAVFFNLSMSGSNLLTAHLNKIFVVTQGKYDQFGNLISPGNYTELGNILWISWTLGLVMPIIYVLLFLTPWTKNSEPLAHRLWLRFKNRKF